MNLMHGETPVDYHEARAAQCEYIAQHYRAHPELRAENAIACFEGRAAGHRFRANELRGGRGER